MSKDENETTIVWTANDERATVCSLMPRIWRQCIAAGGEEVDLSSGVRNGQKLVRTFLVPVKSIRIRKQRELTGEALEKMRLRGRALAARKMGLSE